MKIAQIKKTTGNIDGGASGTHTHKKNEGKYIAEVRGVVTFSSLILAQTPLTEYQSSNLCIEVNEKRYKINGHSLRIDVGEEVVIHIDTTSVSTDSPSTVLALQIIKNDSAIFRVMFHSERFRHGSSHYHFAD